MTTPDDKTATAEGTAAPSTTADDAAVGMATGGVRVWKAVGEPISVVQEGTRTFGLGLYKQVFMNPRTGQPETFVTFTKSPGVTTFAVTDDGKIILVRQFKQGAGLIETESPAGLALEDVDPAMLAADRLRNETGYSPQKMIALNNHPFLLAPRKSPSGFNLFLATGCTQVGEQRLTWREEDIQILLVSPPLFWEMVRKGFIRSVETLLAAHMAVARGVIPGEVFFSAS